ncbi:MAG TPA: NUDIX domain-containing protein [Ktedonobacterales bacterium]|nr:NUDIX domain-containing protein [Ktedonobacterales bacterium]
MKGPAMRFQIGVFATVLDNAARVLLVHRTDCDWWCQPGGGMESGETPWEGVIRETREETGFEVAVERLAGIYSWAPREDEVIFGFVCRLVGGELATSDESDDVRFFSPDALPANTFPEHVHRIHDALQGAPRALLTRARGPSSRDVARGSAASP